MQNSKRLVFPVECSHDEYLQAREGPFSSTEKFGLQTKQKPVT